MRVKQKEKKERGVKITQKRSGGMQEGGRRLLNYC